MKLILSIFISTIYLFTFAQDLPTGNFKTSFKKDKIVLPITYRSGANPIVEVNVNGKGPYKFMFDTGGAGEARLDVRLFDELKLKAADSIRTGDGSGKNDRWLPVVKLESIALGEYVISDPRALVRNYNKPGADKIDGVIGLGFFENAVVEFNFEKNQLIIIKGKVDGNAPNIIPFSFDRGVPVIVAELNGKKVSLTFDTGNMGGLTFHSADIAPDIINGEPKVIGRAQTVSNTFEVKEAQLKVPVKIGDLFFENPTININDVIPQANMGIKFSRQMNVIIDVTGRLMKLEKFAAKPLAAPSNVKANEYAGTYEGGRTISLGEDGSLYVKRLAGTALKMIEKKKDVFGLDIVPMAVVNFVRDKSGKIIAINVSADGGTTWEQAKKY